MHVSTKGTEVAQQLSLFCCWTYAASVNFSEFRLYERIITDKRALRSIWWFQFKMRRTTALEENFPLQRLKYFSTGTVSSFRLHLPRDLWSIYATFNRSIVSVSVWPFLSMTKNFPWWKIPQYGPEIYGVQWEFHRIVTTKDISAYS